MAPPGRTMPQLLAAKQTPGFPPPISDLETSPCSQYIWNSLCSQQTFDNPLVWHGGHDLKVPLQAVYWGLLSRKWSPDILYPFFPFPLLNFISCIKMTQNIWKDRVCSGSDGKKGEYRWESICRVIPAIQYHSSEKIQRWLWSYICAFTAFLSPHILYLFTKVTALLISLMLFYSLQQFFCRKLLVH